MGTRDTLKSERINEVRSVVRVWNNLVIACEFEKRELWFTRDINKILERYPTYDKLGVFLSILYEDLRLISDDITSR